MGAGAGADVAFAQHPFPLHKGYRDSGKQPELVQLYCIIFNGTLGAVRISTRAFTAGAAAGYYRESNDTPSENAFCRVAPRVRLSAFAILAAGFFARADDFSSRTSCLVHSRRLVAFAMIKLRFGKNRRCF